jgi:hypothetical protein
MLSGSPHKERILTSPKLQTNPFFNGIKRKKTSAGENGLEGYKTPNKYRSWDDKVFEDMQHQIHFSDSLKDKNIEEITTEDLDKTISPEHKESARKLREILDI